MMTEFSAEELATIAEAVALGPDEGADRLCEAFTGIRRYRAAEIADRIRAGESVTAADGSIVARDISDDRTGVVLREVKP